MTADPLPPDLRPTLEQGLRALDLPPALAPALLDYLRLLLRWNQTYNLTAIRDPREMLVKHLLDSLAMHRHVAEIADAGGELADLGTGPGLPGIPLAIARPGLRVALVESNGKKARFLREAVRKLGLAPRVRVLESRIEAVDEAGRFDAITARALATLPLILQLGGHLLRPDGRLLAMKGVHPVDEIATLPEGWAVQASEPLSVPGLEAERHLVIVAREDAPG
ncbi:16S rRNA (guanine(527)-N(7))-methyltransferase RsmG [Lysobacter sp. SG-8]|uniref:Ribosomal RNA small subunit methyltransferase G n=1 Tax=Marilutibacter penaei TaxID=2759900 RepID=A0A7W3YEG2_9GAMM|nr:16S rRNA (guanine(527)-N(7))-methyltransferase RsmG [Lysobacter penaei]MBB1088754.1 16S rRNA (guanine(527)-N(7))-methyltransferase RsmG [Lysobacter penaei]